MNGISAEYAAAKRANRQRYAQAMGIYDEIIARTQPGGAMEKAGLAQIEAAKTKGIGQETQQMISSGMYGTTTTAGIPARWEAEVGAPARLRLEDILEQRRTTAKLGKAGFIERREDVYPDVGAVAEYERIAAGAPEESLSDWMAKEFGTIGGGISRPAARPPAAVKGTGVVGPTPTKYPPQTGKAFTTIPERKGFEVPITPTTKIPSYFEAVTKPKKKKPTYYPDPWAVSTEYKPTGW